MNYKFRMILSILAVGTSSLACSLLTGPSAPPAATQPPAYVVEPSVPPEIEPLPVPQAASDHPGGLATAQENILTLYDLNGVPVSQVELPQFTFPGRGRIHIAGKMPASGEVVPLLYFSFSNEESLHFRDGNGQIFVLASGPSFLGLTGVPGQPIVAFAQIEYLDVNLRSKIYVGSIQNLTSAAPVSTIDDPESWAIKPLWVEAENNTPTKIWYTRTAYGIGGDIVFEPRKGLFMLELATGRESTILGNDVSPWAISADRNWLAYSSELFPPNPVCVMNLQSGAEVCFPQLPASDSRGTGNAHLSPDAQYVAWMEADGSLMAEVPNFTATVRVGQMNGAVIADLPMNNFESTAGIGSLSRAEPVGWLDNQALIVQVRGQEWEQVALLRYNILNQEISFLAPGEFVGLLYP